MDSLLVQEVTGIPVIRINRCHYITENVNKSNCRDTIKFVRRAVTGNTDEFATDGGIYFEEYSE